MIKRSYISDEGYVLIWSTTNKPTLDSVMLYMVEGGALTRIDQAYFTEQEIHDNWEEYTRDISAGYIKRCTKPYEWFFG